MGGRYSHHLREARILRHERDRRYEHGRAGREGSRMDSRRVSTVDALGMLERRRRFPRRSLSIGALSSGAVSLGSFLWPGSIRTQALVTACVAVAWVGGLIEGNR